MDVKTPFYNTANLLENRKSSAKKYEEVLSELAENISGKSRNNLNYLFWGRGPLTMIGVLKNLGF